MFWCTETPFQNGQFVGIIQILLNGPVSQSKRTHHVAQARSQNDRAENDLFQVEDSFLSQTFRTVQGAAGTSAHFSNITDIIVAYSWDMVMTRSLEESRTLQVQRQTAVTAHFSSKQLLLFAFASPF